MSNSQLGEDSSSETSRRNARRVVTGTGADGKSIILYDDNEGHVWYVVSLTFETLPNESTFRTPEPNGTKSVPRHSDTVVILTLHLNRFQYLWWTDKVPVEISGDTDKDPTVGEKDFQISNQGSVSCVNPLWFVWLQPGLGAVGSCNRLDKTRRIIPTTFHSFH